MPSVGGGLRTPAASMVARPAGCCNDHVTEVSGLPVTCALNWKPGPSAETVTLSGSIAIETAAGDTVAVATAILVGSATLRALTWNVPLACGAVHEPSCCIDPESADHCTRASFVPETWAVNRMVDCGETAASCGETLMATTADAFTTTAAWAEALRSALLVATTWNVPGAAGAV